jgi:hypothetical protein
MMIDSCQPRHGRAGMRLTPFGRFASASAFAIAAAMTTQTAAAQSSGASTTSISAQTLGRDAADVSRLNQPDEPDAFVAQIGATHWSGDFGGPRNAGISVGLVSLRYSTDRLRIGAILPWMEIRSSGTIYTGIEGAPLIVAPTRSAFGPRRRGFGDVTLSAAYDVLGRSGNELGLEVAGRIKVPTSASSTGLSTGKVDYAASATVTKPIGPVTPLATLSYRVFGDPSGVRIRNSIATSLGGIVQPDARTALIVTYDYAERTSLFVEDSHELVGGVSRTLGDRLRATAFASTGLSNGASDYSLGLSLSALFGR